MSGELEQLFPGLSQSTYKITSPKTSEYNCIAWAAHEDYRWWWPAPPPFAYWPSGVPRQESIDAFIQAYETLGFLCCDEKHLEPGYEKIAIYVDKNRKPTHASRLLNNGNWTSKLGSLEDIEHSFEGLENSSYGAVAQILKRPIVDS